MLLIKRHIITQSRGVRAHLPAPSEASLSRGDVCVYSSWFTACTGDATPEERLHLLLHVHTMLVCVHTHEQVVISHFHTQVQIVLSVIHARTSTRANAFFLQTFTHSRVDVANSLSLTHSHPRNVQTRACRLCWGAGGNGSAQSFATINKESSFAHDKTDKSSSVEQC